MKRLLFLSFLLLPALVLGLDEHGHDHGTGVTVQGDPAVVPGSAMATAVTAPAVVMTPTPTATVDLSKAPRISVTRPKFDFGTVDEGPDIIHNFIVRNKGKGPLKITNVGTSCGCTAAVVGDKYPVSAEEKAQGVQGIIPPGGYEAIKATYHTSGRPGHATKIITVSSNDPVNPSFQLQIDMTVTRDVDLQPDRLYFYNVRYKTPRTASVRILGKPGVRLKILSADTASKVVTVTSMAPITEVAQPAVPSPTPGAVSAANIRHGVSLEVALSEGQTIGAFTDEVILKTNNKKKPEVRISVMGEVVGRVQLNPKTFYFTPGQSAPVTIQLAVDPPAGFAIRKVESLKHLVRPYIKKTTGSNGFDQYQLIASVVKDLPKDTDGKDQVVLETNDQDQPAITIDVQVNK